MTSLTWNPTGLHMSGLDVAKNTKTYLATLHCALNLLARFLERSRPPYHRSRFRPLVSSLTSGSQNLRQKQMAPGTTPTSRSMPPSLPLSPRIPSTFHFFPLPQSNVLTQTSARPGLTARNQSGSRTHIPELPVSFLSGAESTR